VKTILEFFCKVKDLDYNDSIKEIFYIGFKVLFTAIFVEKKEINKNNWAEVRVQD